MERCAEIEATRTIFTMLSPNRMDLEDEDEVEGGGSYRQRQGEEEDQDHIQVV